MIINHKGTRTVKDGEDWHGLQTTNLKSLAKLFKRDWAPLMEIQNKIVNKVGDVFFLTKLALNNVPHSSDFSHKYSFNQLF